MRSAEILVLQGRNFNYKSGGKKNANEKVLKTSLNLNKDLAEAL